MKKILAFAALALAPAALLAQAAPAVRDGIPPLTVGGYYSYFSPDYNPNNLSGAGVYVDWNLRLLKRIGVEGEARWLRFNQTQGSYEDNYLVGPRYARRYGKFVPYVKFLMGAGELEFNSNEGHGGYFAMAPGGGVDYRVTRKLSIRLIDYEYQFWPSALGGGLPSNGLSPHGFSFGAGYRIF
jgi:opacity protein-like surface antigen